MKYQIYDNNIKVELNFTDYSNPIDVNTRYVRCYLSFNSNEEAARFCFKLMAISQM